MQTGFVTAKCVAFMKYSVGPEPIFWYSAIKRNIK